MTALNVALARHNLIEQQIRPWDVLNQQILDVLAALPREDFVPAAYRHLAFGDIALPIGEDEYMFKPNMEGRILQALAVQPADRVLEIGTGTGYLTAALSRMAANVVSVDCHAAFTAQAALLLKAHGCDNVRLETGDASHSWGNARYDAIAMTGAVPAIPDAYKNSLHLGGRLFVIVGTRKVMEALLITRVGRQEWVQESLFDTALPFLKGVKMPSTFTF